VDGQRHPHFADVSDEDLIRRFCASPPDREAGEELARQCLLKLQAAIRRLVYAKSSLCPRTEDRQAFLDDAVSRASAYFLRGISTYRFEGSFEGWLRKLAQRAALDERRSIVGRAREAAPAHEPLEAAERKAVAEAAQPLFQSKYWKDPSTLVEDREHSELVTGVLRLHAQSCLHDAESAGALRLRVWEGVTVREIAEKRGSSERDAWRLFADNLRKLRALLAEKYGISKLRHA